jgi:tripartite-type tricarboxylate transporter receptor subunit TctC
MAVVLGLSAISNVAAQSYPTRQVTVINPLPPGPTSDFLCRTVAEGLRSAFGQPFILENRPGAAGTIGAEFVARANPDGHVLLCAPEFNFLTQLVFPRLSFDPLALEPVSVLATFPSVIVGRADLPAGNLAELILYARKHPGKLNYASQGKGSIAHLTFEALKMKADIDIVHIPYRGGAPALNDLLAGQVDVYAGPLVGSAPYIRAGKLKLLAITSPARVAAFPDVPALAEVFPGLKVDTWMSLAAPPQTPREVTQKLSAVIATLMQSPDVRSRLEDLHAEPFGSTPEQMAERIRRSAERWKPVITKAKITID